MAEVAASSDLAPRGLFSLPDEILLLILTYIPPSTVLSLSLTSRRLYTVTLSPKLWQHYCQTSFTHWDKRHCLESRLNNKSFTGWKSLFAARHASSTVAQRAFNSMLDSETDRFDHIHTILSVGYDAKDILLSAYENARGEERHLAQRYWSHAVLGCLQRWLAVEQWKNIKHASEQTPNETEISFTGLDMFVLGERKEGDSKDIFTRLDSYVASVRAAMPDIDTSATREKAILIAQHLLANGWIGISDTRDYHSLDHMYLGISLFSTNRNSIPLISAIIYCYVCRQLNLYAQPISYPFHVYALVRPPPGRDLDDHPLPDDFQSTSTETASMVNLYMDPFSSAQPVSMAYLLQQLSFVAPHTTPIQKEAFLSPSSARDLTIRAAHNIISSPNYYPHPPLFPIPAHAASYGALFSLCLLPQTPHPAQLRQHLAVLAQHFLEHFDLDVELFETHILPLTTALPDARAYRRLIDNLRQQDSHVPKPKRRHPPTEAENRKREEDNERDFHANNMPGAFQPKDSEDDDSENSWRDNSVVKYKIGQVFRHKRRGYLAVIYGWDPYCKMQEQWIVMNGVDRLPLGRGQPFYNVLVNDESTRYVAEENVVLLDKVELEAEEQRIYGDDGIVQRFPIEIGKWFKRWDKERGRFVSNVTGEYPDD